MTTPMNLLLIEDNPGDARLVKEELYCVFPRVKIHLEHADRLEAGLAYLAANPVDAVLVDLSLPDSDGLETLQRVVACVPQTPVIVMTGVEDEATALKALQAGAQDYLIKGQVDSRLLTRVIQYGIQRKKTEMQLADALQFTSHIVTSSPVGIFTYKLSGECLSVNAAGSQMVGGTIEQLQSQNFHRIESWKQSGLYTLAIRAINTGKPVADDVHIFTTFGRDAWYRAQFVKFRSGDAELLLMMFSDITERKLTERVMQEHEMLLDKTQAIAHVGSWELDLVNNHVTWSDEVYRIFGVGTRDFKGTYDAFLETVYPDDRSRVDDSFSESLRKRLYSYEIEHRIVHQTSGEIRFVHIKCEHLRGDWGQIVRSIGMVQDITERKKAEAEVAAMQRRFRALIENAPDGIALLGMDGKLGQVTPSTEKILGYTMAEAKGQDLALLTHPEDLPALLSLLDDLIQKPETVVRAHHRFRHKDGSWRCLESTMTNLIAEPSVQSIVFNYRDITENRQAEANLREKEFLLSEAQRIGRIGSWTCDIASGRMRFSDQMYHLLDVQPEEFHHNREDFLALVYPSDRPAAARWFVSLSEDAQVTDLDFRLFHKNGELRYLHCTGATEFDSATNALRFIGTLQDITEQRAAEMQIDQQIKQLTALSEIDRAIISSFDQRYILNVILSQVRAQLHVDAADILLLDSEGKLLRYGAGVGFRTKFIETAQLRVGALYAGQAAKERRMIRLLDINEATTSAAFREFTKAEGFVSYIGVPLVVKGNVKGVLEVFQRSSLQPYQDWLDFFHTIVGQAALAIENTSLFEDLRTTNHELIQAYDTTIEGWSRAMDLRARETEGHTQRVMKLTLTIARAMGINEAQWMHIRRGALLHDIGKLGVPDHVLFKPGALTIEERALIERHVDFAYEMLAPIRYLKPALNIPYFHHEKWDGTGYPLGLKGEQIPLEARIFAVVDVWDALLSDRPHRPAWARARVIEYIQAQAGAQFDPRVVECFLEIIEKPD